MNLMFIQSGSPQENRNECFVMLYVAMLCYICHCFVGVYTEIVMLSNSPDAKKKKKANM